MIQRRLLTSMFGVAIAAILVFGMMWRFWSFKRWVFTDSSGYEATPLQAAIRTTE